MRDLGLVFALITAGYIVGVWTGGLVFKQRQRAYEDAVPATVANSPMIVIGTPSPRAGRH